MYDKTLYAPLEASVESLAPSKEIRELIERLITQHDSIIAMNRMIVERLLDVPFVVKGVGSPEEECP